MPSWSPPSMKAFCTQTTFPVSAQWRFSSIWFWPGELLPVSFFPAQTRSQSTCRSLPPCFFCPSLHYPCWTSPVCDGLCRCFSEKNKERCMARVVRTLGGTDGRLRSEGESSPPATLGSLFELFTQHFFVIRGSLAIFDFLMPKLSRTPPPCPVGHQHGRTTSRVQYF